MAKKYHWLKLKDDFFTSKPMLKLRRIAGGDTYTIIYLKLQLLSLQDEGRLFFDEVEDTFSEELSLVLGEDAANIEATLLFLQKCGLAEFESETEIFLTDVPKVIGKEADKLEESREKTRARVAKHREKKRLEMGIETCAYCGGKATGIDHILAIARGGGNEEENKVPCCAECNRIKNDKPLVDFLNSNRDRIRDDLVTSNEKLKRFVTLCNVTGCYKVTQGNALEKEKEKDIEKEREKEKKKDPKPDSFASVFEEFFISDRLKAAIMDFIDYRESIGIPTNAGSLGALIKKLNELSGSEDEALAILEQSIANGWKGLFELKDKGKKPKTGGKGTGNFGIYEQRNFDYSDIEKKIRGYEE